MPDPSGPRAGFWQRFGAALIDGIVVGIPFGVVFAITRNALAYVVGLILTVAYFTYFEGSPSGQTPGKRLVGIRVIDFGGGGSIGHGRALLRLVCRYLSQLPCYLGYLWMLWDKERQTWHDKLVNDVVVPVADYPVERWPG